MKQAMEWKIVTVAIICMVTIVGFAQGQDVDESGSNVKGQVRFRYDFFEVNKDRGRFREDQWRTDQSTGALDWLHLESIEPDENGYEWIFEGRALYDYDYRMSLLLKKQDSHYLKLDFTGFRRYEDGSNEYWDPTLYSLDKSFAEMSDSRFYIDRRSYNIELGLTPSEGPEVIFGWHRLEKKGKEVLLRGARARVTGDPVPRFRGIPAWADVYGITDTFYAEIAQTFAEKYNFRVRQEFEQYRDEQYIEFPRYKDGAAEQWRTFEDDPGYTNWRTMFMFDSFLDEETYVTANYMYNYLNNDTTRDVVRLAKGGATPNLDYFIANRVGNSRRTNVGAFGYRKANVLQIPALHFSAGFRIEDSKTSSFGDGWKDTAYRDSRSKLDEVQIAETLRLVYKGIERTTLSFDADLEQRYLDWSEREDVTDYEIGGAGVGGYLERSADIDYTDQIYTLKAVRRFNHAVKSTVKFRIKDLERSYTEIFDNDLTYYPGIIGSYRRTGEDLTVKTDFRLNSKTSTTLLYQFVQESINTALGGKTSNLEIHRGAGSISFSPTQNLFLVGTFMLENYRLDSPASGDGSNSIATGSRPFDYRGNSYSLLLDGTYAFNEKTSCNFGFQHTEALGTVDYAGNYAYDKVYAGLNFEIAKNQTVGVGYQFLNFNNHDGGSFDDYQAHGALVTYSYTF